MPISSKDQSRINHASNLAEKSNCSKQLGAVLVSSGRVLAQGHNTLRNTSMVTTPYKHAEHAEASVIRQAKGRAHGATVYVSRVKPTGERGMSLPCSRCMMVMFKAGVSRVVFTGDDGAVFELRFSQLREADYKKAADEVVSDRNGFVRNVYIDPQTAVSA